MKTIPRAVLAATALILSACPNDSTTYSAPVCEPAPFTTADPTAAEAYCINSSNALCRRAFGDCSVELYMLSGFFANYADCSSSLTADCQATNYSTTGVNAGCAALCLSDIQTVACSVFLGAEPTECGAATGTVTTPPPACSATISAGTVSGVITAADPVYAGATGGSGYAKAYCISLTAGQTVTIYTSDPTAGTPIYDTYLHLLGPSGTQVAYDDDSGTGLYSQITSYPVTTTGSYRIIVRGWSTYDVGGYQLTVSIY